MTDTPSTPHHISYSAYTEWLECGKRYQLKRMMSLPERPAWWNIGGHAVHSATEAYCRQTHATLGI